MAGSQLHKRVARAAAISILSVIGLLLAVWAAPRVSDAAAAWVSAPPVRTTTTTLPAALAVSQPQADGAARAATDGASAPGGADAPAVDASPVIDAGMRFTMAGVTCRPPASQGAVEVLLRVSDDGAVWGRWYTVALERVAEEGGEEQAFTEPIWTDSGRYLQVAARSVGAQSAPTRLDGVEVVAINSTEDADRGDLAVGVLRRAAATVAGIDLAPPVGAMTTKPAIVLREQWGANESWRTGSPSYAPVKMAFVHHTASGNVYTKAEAPAIMRGIYAYHTKSLHWSDVGYNFVIDRYGTIYEGRFGGMTRGVIGAQVLGFNTGSTGISVIGTFSSATPPSAAVSSLEKLLAWKLDIHHVNPLGTGTLVCGYGQKFSTGQSVRFPAIAGHRNANYTDCPGARLYSLLPSVRKVVAHRGEPKIYGFVVSAAAISPNGDDVRDKTMIRFTVSKSAAWRIAITNDAGKVVRHISGGGTLVESTWAGRDDDGRLLPDGVYTLEAGATSAAGEARPATATIRIDTTAPRVGNAAAAPDPFSPNADGYEDVTVLTFTPSESGSARVSVVNDASTVLRRLTAWKTVGATAQRVKWDGRVSSGTSLVPAAEGPATLLLELRDTAGNVTSVRRTVTLDRTLALGALSRRIFSPNGDGRYESIVLAFKLTHPADVTVAVLRAGATVRTIGLGKLAAGSRSVTWDGVLGGGDTATSGNYSLKLSADGPVGVSTAKKGIVVDLSPPKVIAPATATVTYGKTARVTYIARDAFSPSVKVGVVITDSAGLTVATRANAWVRQGVAQVCAWKPRARGSYRLTFRAQDQGANRLAGAVATTLKVR